MQKGIAVNVKGATVNLTAKYSSSSVVPPFRTSKEEVQRFLLLEQEAWQKMSLLHAGSVYTVPSFVEFEEWTFAKEEDNDFLLLPADRSRIWERMFQPELIDFVTDHEVNGPDQIFYTTGPGTNVVFLGTRFLPSCIRSNILLSFLFDDEKVRHWVHHSGNWPEASLLVDRFFKPHPILSK